MLKTDVRLMAKLGIITDETQMGDVFLFWGKVLRDPVLFQKRWDIKDEKYSMLAEPGEAIPKMTPKEKLELRNRVLGIREFPVAQ